MSYSKKDILTSLSLMVFIISFAIVFTVFFKPLYYFDIHHLDIPSMSGLSVETIKENYKILIDYQSIFYQGPLVFKDFVMSTGGRIHFEEVKRIFVILQIVMSVSFVSSIILIVQQYKHKEFRFLKLTAILTVIIPLIIATFAAIDFDQAFIMFHKIAFNNDYWIFSVFSDPVITILPEDFFMHCFMMIVFLVVSLSGISYGIYCYLRRRFLMQNK